MTTITRTTNIGCTWFGIVLLVYMILSYWSVDYITNYFGTDLPWITDMLIGMVSLSVSFWIALILLIFG